MDTDSVFVIHDKNKNLEGIDLGNNLKWVNTKPIKDAVFLSPTLYGVLYEDGTEEVKLKGSLKESISFNEIKERIKIKKILAIHTQFKKEKLRNIKIIKYIKRNFFTKRTKRTYLSDDKGLWTGEKTPIHIKINEIESIMPLNIIKTGRTIKCEPDRGIIAVNNINELIEISSFEGKYKLDVNTDYIGGRPLIIIKININESDLLTEYTNDLYKTRVLLWNNNQDKIKSVHFTFNAENIVNTFGQHIHSLGFLISFGIDKISKQIEYDLTKVIFMYNEREDNFYEGISSISANFMIISEEAIKTIIKNVK